MRWLPLLLLIAARCFAVSIDQCPAYNAGAGGTGAYNQAAVLNGSGDKLTVWCGIPSNGDGAPLLNKANFGTYSSNAYVNFTSTAMPQRSLDSQAAYGYSTLLSGSGNNQCNVIVLTSGGNKHLGALSLWQQVTVSSVTYPGFAFEVSDPGQVATAGCNFFFMPYETEGTVQLHSDLTSGNTAACIDTIANVDTPTVAELNSLGGGATPVQITFEGETRSISSASTSPGAPCAGANRQYNLSSAVGSTHTTGKLGWLSDSTGKRLADASIYSLVTLLNYIACGPSDDGNSLGNYQDIRLLGISNGSWIIGQVAMMGAADKTTFRTNANSEYTCSRKDSWQVTTAVLSSPPLDQSAVTVLSSDNSEPLLNAAHLGFGTSGAIQSTTSLWDSGCTGNGASKCSLGACTTNGLTPNGTMSTVDLYAHQNSPQQNAKGNVPGSCTAWNSCPGVMNTPTSLPPLAVNIGNDDKNVVPDQASCFSQTFNTPYLLANDCNGGNCGHAVCEIGGNLYSSWYVQDQCVSFELKNLYIYDNKYSLTYASSHVAGSAAF